MDERFVFLDPKKANEFMHGICTLGIETDTGFRVDTHGGNIMLHIRGAQDALGSVSTVPGYVLMTDRP